MGYALKVHYGEDESVLVPLPDVDADAAETERQALVTRVEHAHDIEAPEITARDTPPGDDVVLAPDRVTGVDLVET